MALSEERKRLLALRNLDSTRTRKRLEGYLARSGMDYNLFARIINYSGVTLRFFLAGNYHSVSGNDRSLCAAINDYMDAHPLMPETGKPARFYPSRDLTTLRRYFYKALDHNRGYYLYGPPGLDKTELARYLIADLNLKEASKNGSARRAYRVYVPFDPRPTDLLKRIALAAGVPAIGNADRIIRALRFEFRGRRVLFVFDEAQNLNKPCLEKIRELLDEPPHCGMLFLGSHDLKLPFVQWDMGQWDSRIKGGVILQGFSEEDAERALRAELGELSKKEVAAFIADAREHDFRQGKQYTYISARKLFGAIDELKDAVAEKSQ